MVSLTDSGLGIVFVLFSFFLFFLVPAHDPFPENKQTSSLAHVADKAGQREGLRHGDLRIPLVSPHRVLPPGVVLPGLLHRTKPPASFYELSGHISRKTQFRS